MTKGGTTTMVGGIVAAFFASICCIGPVVFAALGVGAGATGFLASTTGFLKTLLPYRPIFIGLTLILVAISFYLAYQKPESAMCASGKVCVPGPMRGANRTLLWGLTVLAMALILAPYWLGL